MQPSTDFDLVASRDAGNAPWKNVNVYEVEFPKRSTPSVVHYPRSIVALDKNRYVKRIRWKSFSGKSHSPLFNDYWGLCHLPVLWTGGRSKLLISASTLKANYGVEALINRAGYSSLPRGGEASRATASREECTECEAHELNHSNDGGAEMNLVTGLLDWREGVQSVYNY
ncbi:hypothetical protein BC936DRAFT_147289 [Jimgerdemannia flammicorona]|uniref:Uncharacterized protein n=1 Tax=Jimgerdemannia flammicorona TaxID=994334 RepID=A0A433DL19_9FUNG|nr:hypothetical protein BC936DRAFT_147289 [Jimgerdemannia flammicorona]